jgi:peroxiredoxin
MQRYSHLIAIRGVILAMSAQGEIPSDPAQVHPLPVGARAPMFEGVTTDGKLRHFTPNGFRQPTIVIFYCGGWCPYCDMQLSDLRLAEPKLREQGFEIVFLSTDRPAILYSSLKATNIHYTLLSDSHLEAAKAFHVAYHLDDATLEKQRQYGVDLDATTGTTLHELPVPSVFIIDTTGTIRYVYSNPDYKVRIASDALLAAAQPYATGSIASK